MLEPLLQHGANAVAHPSWPATERRFRELYRGSGAADYAPPSSARPTDAP